MPEASNKRRRFATPPPQVMALIVIAVLCGVAGMGVRWLSAPEAPPPPKPKPIEIPVAAADLKPGRTIKGSDFYMRAFTSQEMKELPCGQVFMNGAQMVGRVVREEIPRGQTFCLDAVYPEGTGPTVSDLLQPGFRAVSVAVELVGGVRGFAQPDSWVDVMFRRQDAASGGQSDIPRTHTLFHSVQVLAVRDNLYPQSTLPNVSRRGRDETYEITLALTPEQAEVLKSVEGRGTISLTLLPRGEANMAAGDVPTARDMKEILGISDPPPPPEPTPEPPQVEVFHGGAAKNVVVQSKVHAGNVPVETFQSSPTSPGWPMAVPLDCATPGAPLMPGTNRPTPAEPDHQQLPAAPSGDAPFLVPPQQQSPMVPPPVSSTRSSGMGRTTQFRQQSVPSSASAPSRGVLRAPQRGATLGVAGQPSDLFRERR